MLNSYSAPRPIHTPMKKLIPVLALVTLVAAAQAGPNDAVKKQLTANYKAFSTAFQTKNIDSVAGLMTDDYTVVQPGGQIAKKAQIVATFKQEAAMMSDTKWVRTITNLTTKGNQAIAIVDGNFTGHLAGQDGKAHDFKLVATTQDTWTKTPKGYKLQKSVVQKNVVTIDGKVMTRPGG
jgi:ketosteroid isomerase-like protein